MYNMDNQQSERNLNEAGNLYKRYFYLHESSYNMTIFIKKILTFNWHYVNSQALIMLTLSMAAWLYSQNYLIHILKSLKKGHS